MTHRTVLFVLLLTASVAAASCTARVSPSPAVSGQMGATTTQGRITVGPNVAVSAVAGDGADYNHRELMVAAAPWDPDVLIGAGVESFSGDRYGAEASYKAGKRNVAYTTTDGGMTWRAHVVPRGPRADPIVAVGRSRTLFFGGLRPSARLVMARSGDLGETWSEPIEIGPTDHPQLTVDFTAGRFTGRVYIIGKGGCGTASKALCLWRSTDDGRSWQGPVVFEGSADANYQTNNPLVLSDGTLILPYVRQYSTRYQTSPDTTKARPLTTFHTDAVLVTSTDGGDTFGERMTVYQGESTPGISGAPNNLPPLFPHYAVDTSSRYPNRIYAAWLDQRLEPGGRNRVFVRRSDDRGRTWSPAVQVDPTTPAGAMHWMPTIAVNKDGVVGVRWLDSRPAPPAKDVRVGIEWFHDEYFAASVDGGATFLPAVRVSSASSVPQVDRPLWLATVSEQGDTAVVFGSRASQDALDDYLGLTADARGVFWPFWPDTRNGARHVYTAAIRVEEPARRAPRGVVTTLATGTFRVDIESTRYDSTTSVLELTVRVRNLSSQSLHAPVRLTATASPAREPMAQDVYAGVKVPSSLPANYAPRDSTSAISFLNGERLAADAAAATYDLEPVLRGWNVLLPGERTAPLVLRLKVPKTANGGRLVGGRLIFALTAATPAPAQTRKTLDKLHSN